jgi:hypothetical protein
MPCIGRNATLNITLTDKTSAIFHTVSDFSGVLIISPRISIRTAATHR